MMVFIFLFTFFIVSIKSTNEGLFSLDELSGKVFLNKKEIYIFKEDDPKTNVLILI